MKETAPIFLPQLPNEIVTDARKTRLCAYAVALEGWRRGLKLKWYTKDSEHFQDMVVFGVNPPGRLFSLSSDTATHYFFRTRGDLVPNEAVEIGSEKDDTKIHLDKADVPVPKGRGFSPETLDEEIISYGRSLGYPLVLKPTDGSLGAGVVTNIQDEQELIKALEYVREELEYEEVVVEQYVTGEEYRLYVVEDKVVAAYNRVAANITGDGEHTINELIDLKNRQRKRNARLYSCLIEIDVEIIEFIEAAGYTLESVPEKGEKIYLRQKTNVSSGGDPIDVLDDLSDDIKEIAINALKAVPGLKHGGVDIIINEGNVSHHPAVVIELNPTAQIGGALYPLKGESRNIPAAIIDYYFPETKGMDTTDSNVYFELTTVLEPLENRSAVEVEVNQAPQGKMYAKRYIVSGTVGRQSYHQWLKKQALDHGLHGHVKNLYYGKIEILVAGTDKDDVARFKQIIEGNPDKSKIDKIKEETYDGFIKVGFDVEESHQPSDLRSVDTALKKMAKDLRRKEKEKYQTEKRNRYIAASNSWKFTTPIRKVGKMLKKDK